ncbi:MAG: methyltransferase domain-containing protein [Caldilineaceae bacterium]
MFEYKKPGISPDLAQLYDVCYSAGLLAQRHALFTWLARLIRVQTGEKVLDVACGDAQFRPMLEAQGAHYVGIDFSRAAVAAAAYPQVLPADAHALPFADQTFDCLVNIGSLEHFADIELGIREMARVLKPSGWAYILMPNAFGLTWNILRVWHTGHIDLEDGQPVQRFGTRRAWQHLLEASGLHVCQTYGYERNWPPTWHEWLHYGRAPRELGLALLTPLIPLNLQRMFVFRCCTKVESCCR